MQSFITFCYVYMGCLNKSFCWKKLFSPEDFSKYNTFFIIPALRIWGERVEDSLLNLHTLKIQTPYNKVSDKTFKILSNQPFFLYIVPLAYFSQETHVIHFSAAYYYNVFSFIKCLTILFLLHGSLVLNVKVDGRSSPRSCSTLCSCPRCGICSSVALDTVVTVDLSSFILIHCRKNQVIHKV